MNPSRGREECQVLDFDDFFSQNYERILRTVFLVVGDSSEAEEVTQEAFAKSYERWDRLDADGNPAGYVYRAALNLHRSNRRKSLLAVRRQAVLPVAQGSALQASEHRDALRRALAGLPQKEREALVLVAWLDMTDKEAAGFLGTSPGAIRTRVSRAKVHLREAEARKDHDE